MAECIECSGDYPDGRAALGYKRCIPCALARPEAPSVFIADVSKSNPTVTCQSSAVCTLGDRVGSSERKAGGFMRLASTKGATRNNGT